MANIVWHTKLDLMLDLTRDDLGHPNLPKLWETIYQTDRLYATRNVPVNQRDLQCGGICRDARVTAWMHLRLRANGRREAVHEHSEDEERHTAPMSDEHMAYQERIIRAAETGGFRADSEVRTPIGPRSWIQTDTLVQGESGLRIGWEIQLSSAGVNGPRSVRARAGKALKHGIVPAWHTDRTDYAQRHDTQWTRSDNLPAHVIAKIGDLRVVSGFRALDFWRCDLRALYPCPVGQRRCGKVHVTPRARDILFDDLVRGTAAGLIVPIEHRTGSRTHRFWVPEADQQRLLDHHSNDTELPPVSTDEDKQSGASRRRPTCRPAATDEPTPHSPPAQLIPSQRAPQLHPNPDQYLPPVREAPAPPPPQTPAPERHHGPAAQEPLRQQRVLDWRSGDHWALEARSCRYCTKPTHLRDDTGAPSHKVCAEAAGQ